ncbi:AsmA family protein [Govanella unica]|uniref:AsmA family protein n=1 Tax=Govanella unica TaxID=2975056 RepID=A0A9X3Z8L3_9PROT|nr:AsmA family protein [Govania unica]MDA5195093.1 AsmA family protein [Govania unica]
MTGKPSERRKFWIAAAGGLGTLVLLALVVPRLIDWNSYKPEIETLASKVTDRSVHVDGPVEVELLPLPVVILNKLRMGNLPGGTAEEMASVERVDVRIAILPLFFGELFVSKVIFDKPVLQLEVLPNGEENWRLGKKKQYLQKVSERTPDLKLDRFAVRDGIVSYRDSVRHWQENVSGVTFELEAKSFDGPFKAGGSLLYRAVPIHFDFTMSRKGVGGKTPFKGTLGFARATLDTSGIVTLGEDLAYTGNASIKSSNVGETMTALQMLAGATDVSGLSLSEPMTAEFRLTASATRIETRGLTLTLGESKGSGQLLFDLGEQPRADIALNFSTIASDVFLQAMPPRDAKSPPITLADIFDALDPGSIVGEVTLSADEIRQGKQVIRQAEVKVSAAEGKVIVKKFHALLPGGSDVDVAGILTTGEAPRFDGRIVTASNNLRVLLDWMDVEIKGVPPGRLTGFAIASTLAVDRSGYRFSDAVFRLDDMMARGEVVYEPGDAPVIGVTAHADRLSLGNYLAPGSDCVGGGSDDNLNARVFDGALAPTDGFDVGSLTLTLKLTVDKFSCRPITGHAVTIDAKLTGGRFELDRFKAQDLLGLAVDGKGHIETIANQPRFDFHMSAEGQSLAGLGTAFPQLLPIKADKAAGKVSLKGKVEGTLDELRLSLGGQAGAATVTAKAELGFTKQKHRGGRGLVGMAVEVAAKGPSFAAFTDQWDFGFGTPAAADDHAYALTAGYRGTSQKADVDIKAALAGATVTLTGSTRELRDTRTYEFALLVKGDDARAFVRGLGFDFARDARAFGPIEMAGTIVSDPHTIAVQALTGDFGPLQLTGGLVIGRGGPRPRITGDLKAGAVDLDQLLGSAPKLPGELWSREPYHLDLFKSFDGDLRISAESLATQGFLFDQPRLTLMVDKGRMEIRQLTGGLFGGTVALNYLIAPQGGSTLPGIGLGFALKNASLQQLLEATSNVSGLSGTVTLQGTLAGLGANPYDLMRGLHGQMNFAIGPGIVSGLDLPGLNSKLTTLRESAGYGDLFATALSSGETEHRGMTGQLVMRKGVIGLTETTIPLDGGQAVLALNVDLPAKTVWSSGRLQLTDHMPLTPIGMIISGPLSNPQIRYLSRDMQAQRARQIGRPLNPVKPVVPPPGG